MKFKKYLNEGKKIPEIIKLGLKASKYNVNDMDMPRAVTIGAMTHVMPEFQKKKVVPMDGSGFNIKINGGNIVVVLNPKGKKTIRIRMEKNPSYLNDVTSVFKVAYKRYFERISKTLKEGSLNEGVGETILKQIKSINRHALPSYGAKNFVTSKDGVQFDVRGSKHKGKVIIKLKNDLYSIEIGNVRKLEWKSKLRKAGIYVDSLVDVLDSLVG